MLDIKKEQHYVPKTYLKNFSNKDNFLKVFDADIPKQVKNRTYASICYDDFFYGVETGKYDELSQYVESFLQNTENLVGGKNLRRIINKIESNQQIVEKDIKTLSLLISNLWLRSPGMREQIKLNNENLLEQMKEWYPDKDFSKEYEYIETNIPHINLLMKAYKYSNLLLIKKWTFHISKTDNLFMTSDSPVSEVSPPIKGVFSNNILLRKHYLSLTPNILIELSPNKNKEIKFTKAKRKTHFSDEDNFIKKYNMYVINHCFKYSYSYDQITLDNIIEKIEIAKNTGISFYEMSY